MGFYLQEPNRTLLGIIDSFSENYSITTYCAYIEKPTFNLIGDNY